MSLAVPPLGVTSSHNQALFKGAIYAPPPKDRGQWHIDYVTIEGNP